MTGFQLVSQTSYIDTMAHEEAFLWWALCLRLIPVCLCSVTVRMKTLGMLGVDTSYKKRISEELGVFSLPVEAQ